MKCRKCGYTNDFLSQCPFCQPRDRRPRLRTRIQGGRGMIEGCSNHNCAVTGKTGGQDTNGACKCVQIGAEFHHYRENCFPVLICGQCIGPTVEGGEVRAVKRWLQNGGLSDILKMAETDKKGEETHEQRTTE